MVIVACADDLYGMMFNHRRQSKDLAVTEDICHMIDSEEGNVKMWIKQYSSSLFVDKEELCNRIIVDDAFSEKCNKADFCFIEGEISAELLGRAEKVILYRWNRVYPSDCKLDSAALEDAFAKTQIIEFAGSSHELITKEIYIKKKKSNRKEIYEQI